MSAATAALPAADEPMQMRFCYMYFCDRQGQVIKPKRRTSEGPVIRIWMTGSSPDPTSQLNTDHAWPAHLEHPYFTTYTISTTATEGGPYHCVLQTLAGYTSVCMKFTICTEYQRCME